jgi:hypothetical protein
LPDATQGIEPDVFPRLTVQRREAKAPASEEEVHPSSIDGGVE